MRKMPMRSCYRMLTQSARCACVFLYFDAMLKLSPKPQNALRVVSWNIHKGVMGVGPMRKLHIHRLAEAVQALDADVVCLQEVRHFNNKEQRYFHDWPSVCQSEVLAPDSHQAVYRTNAVTKHGEHGNALLARHTVQAVHHRDMSDHRLEQRGLLHVVLEQPMGNGAKSPLHVLVVHLGLIHGSRVRQMQQLQEYVEAHIPVGEQLVVAGDFNTSSVAKKWAEQRMRLQRVPQTVPTFPARMPLLQLDHVFWRRGSACAVQVPRGAPWNTLSDHLPLVVDIALDATERQAL